MKVLHTGIYKCFPNAEDRKLIKIALIKAGITQENFAQEAMKLSAKSLSCKLNGHNGSYLTLDEVNRIQHLLSIEFKQETISD